MTTQNIIWAVSQISVWINEEVGTTQDSLIVWYCKNGTEVTLDTEDNTLQICDSKLDNKTYFALAGLCKSLEVELFDTYTEKTMKQKLLQQIKDINIYDYFYFLGQNSSVKVLKEYLVESK